MEFPLPGNLSRSLTMYASRAPPPPYAPGGHRPSSFNGPFPGSRSEAAGGAAGGSAGGSAGGAAGGGFFDEGEPSGAGTGGAGAQDLPPGCPIPGDDDANAEANMITSAERTGTCTLCQFNGESAGILNPLYKILEDPQLDSCQMLKNFMAAAEAVKRRAQNEGIPNVPEFTVEQARTHILMHLSINPELLLKRQLEVLYKVSVVLRQNLCPEEFEFLEQSNEKQAYINPKALQLYRQVAKDQREVVRLLMMSPSRKTQPSSHTGTN